MTSEGFDFISRLHSFLEVFGMGGMLLVLFFVAVVVGITFVRGPGLLLFVLFLSYSLGAIPSGGIIFLSTLVRWGSLLLLGISFFKMHVFPRPPILLFILYVFLGMVFIVFAPSPKWSIQQGLLLLVTVVCLAVSISCYVDSIDKIGRLFKMGIIAASAWTVANFLFFQNFLYSASLRYSISEEVTGVTVVFAGAFFAPMIFWGIVQKKFPIWRIYCFVLVVPYLIIMLAAGVRSVIFGMILIASLPILLFKVKPLKLLGILSLFILIGTVSILILYSLLPQKAEYLVERFMSTGTTGRTSRWLSALDLCLNQAFFVGRGTGSAGVISKSELGILFHNTYLSIWVDTGLIGLFSVLLFLFIYTMKGMKLIIRSFSVEISEYSRILFGYLLGIAAMGLVEGVFSTASGIGTSMLIIVTTLMDRMDFLIKQEQMDNLVNYYCLFDGSEENPQYILDQSNLIYG